MSLDSYKKSIEAQRKRAQYFGYVQEAQNSSESSGNKTPVKTKKKPKSRQLGNIISVIMIAVLFLAALKNPSHKEAEEAINMKIAEMYGVNKIFADIVLTTLSLNNLEMSDYILFTTFNMKNLKDEDNTIISGIIIFGKVIPIKNDLDKFFKDFYKDLKFYH